MFKGIEDFVVEGGGTIDGKGEIWWEHSCKINKSLPCTRAPTALIFYQCKNFRMMNLRIKDAQQMHLSFQKCMNLQVSNLMVTAPGRSPNTDGIHVTETQNIQIMSSVIRTGDDCISIVSGSQNVQVTDITCGPGHGISIGSLGQGKSEAHVSNVKVDTVRLIDTTNGVRIKTWKGGSGNASNIVFQNVTVQNVSNPIIIDQNYCDQEKPCKDQKSAVQISNVVYRHIRGTSATKFAIKFNCSKNHPCDDILLEDVDLTSDEDADVEADVEALCMNVQLYERGIVSPTCQCKKRCMAMG
ncbi:hypothetical protein Sjap_002362 [Stephania japonica]|uniref:Polygalacturonase n=1 Tax=Stephania japonica TaxID=461633 RepID=A0AAP0PSK7_9MAGN